MCVSASQPDFRLASEIVAVGALLMLAIIVLDVFATELFVLTGAVSVFTDVFVFRIWIFSMFTLIAVVVIFARVRGGLGLVYRR